MSLNDLQWLNCHFTSNFHYCELAMRVLVARFESIFTYEHVIRQKAEADRQADRQTDKQTMTTQSNNTKRNDYKK